jgi:Family of unknown function (DUF5706)
MGSGAQGPKATRSDAGVDEYLKQALSEAASWYKQADSKAQTILGFTGVYLSIVVGSVVLKRDSTILWMTAMPFRVCLALILLLYVLGIVFCVAALWSRGMIRSTRSGIFFFGHVANYPDGATYLSAAAEALSDASRLRESWAEQVLILSRNTRRKHQLVNLAVLCSGAALLSTIVVGFILFVQTNATQ